MFIFSFDVLVELLTSMGKPADIFLTPSNTLSSNVVVSGRNPSLVQCPFVEYDAVILLFLFFFWFLWLYVGRWSLTLLDLLWEYGFCRCQNIQ